MTAAQDQAIKQIMEIAREHFDASVFVGQGEAVNVENPDSVSDIQYVYHGGYAAAIGLIELGRIHVWKKGTDRSETND